MEHYLHIAQGRVSYQKMGKGSRILIAFHGFADHAGMFEPFADVPGDNYTIYAIDLPFHGETQWHQTYYTPKDINGIINAILEKESCLSYDLLGYSLGGTIILSMLGRFGEAPERIFLLAPGGVKVRGLSSGFSIPLWGKKVIYQITKNPNWLIALVGFLTKIGLLNSFYIRYIKAQMRLPEKHKRLLYTWYALSFFKVDKARVIEAVKRKEIQVTILLGDRDKIIDGAAIRQAFGLQPLFTIINVENNHLMLNESVAAVLAKNVLGK